MKYKVENTKIGPKNHFCQMILENDNIWNLLQHIDLSQKFQGLGVAILYKTNTWTTSQNTWRRESKSGKSNTNLMYF